MEKSIPKYRDWKNVGIPTRLGKTREAQNPKKGLRNLVGEQEEDSRHPQQDGEEGCMWEWDSPFARFFVFFPHIPTKVR